MRVLRCGSSAVLVELDDERQVIGLHASLVAEPPAGTTEFVPAARTVLVRYDPARISIRQLTAEVTSRDHHVEEGRLDRLVEIPVHYDGDDLADVARLAGMSVQDVITRHLAGDYTVAFTGFAPGFAYLTGVDPVLHVPRHSAPRARVDAGAVALADRFTGIYPRPSPGGWRIIGHTDMPTWNLDHQPPTVLTPGTRVRFTEAVQ